MFSGLNWIRIESTGCSERGDEKSGSVEAGQNIGCWERAPPPRAGKPVSVTW
jgi:hypothetical protein